MASSMTRMLGHRQPNQVKTIEPVEPEPAKSEEIVTAQIDPDQLSVSMVNPIEETVTTQEDLSAVDILSEEVPAQKPEKKKSSKKEKAVSVYTPEIAGGSTETATQTADDKKNLKKKEKREKKQ